MQTLQFDRVFACRRLWDELGRFPQPSVSSFFLFLPCRPPLHVGMKYFADVPKNRFETDRVFENVVACLASRSQLLNGSAAADMRPRF